MNWKEMYKMMLQTGGLKGLREAEEALFKLKKEADEPWKKSIFSLLGDAIEKYGMDGIGKVEDIVEKAINGGNPDLSFTSLRSRSDFLAVMQNLEADNKVKVKDFFAQVGEAIGVILKAILAAIVG